MIDAEPARWCVLMLGLELACGRSGTAGSEPESERALAKALLAANDGAPAPYGTGSTARDGLDVGAGSPLRTASEVAAAASSRRAERSAEPAAAGSRPSEPVGGRWVSCYANYRATSTPERDVARLTALCGPDNGMTPVGSIVVGEALDTAEDHRFEARAGDCFRIFAVSDAFVTDLGVEVINARGNAITWDRNGDRWPILNPDGPFCLFDAGTYTIRVRALSGKGRYAMQVWRLP
jgi:hypothetical protein